MSLPVPAFRRLVIASMLLPAIAAAQSPDGRTEGGGAETDFSLPAPPLEPLEPVAPAAPAPTPVAGPAPVVEPPASVSEPAAPAPPRAAPAPEHRRRAPSATGETGLRRTLSATPGEPGLVRLALSGEGFSQRNFLAVGDRNTRLAGTLAASFVPRGAADWLEVFALYRNVSNRNPKNDPPLILTLGDMQLGAKGGVALAPLSGALSVGGDLSLNPRAGVGDVAFELGATSVEARALASFDARRLRPDVPVVAHLNLGWATPARLDAAAGETPTCIEEFATGSSRWHRGLLGLGVESPLPYATPWLEAAVELPAGPDLTDRDGCSLAARREGGTPTLSYGSIVPATLGLGVRVTALRALTFDAGLELGLTRERLRGVRETPAWNLFLGVSHAIDTQPPPPEVREVVREVVKVVREPAPEPPPPPAPVEPPPPTSGFVAGRVRDAVTGEPIRGVVLAIAEGATDASPVATDASGRYRTHEVPAGRLRLTATKDGFEPAEATLDVTAGATVERDLRLTRRVIPPAVLRGTVRDADGRPLPDASVAILGATVYAPSLDPSGAFEQAVAPGAWRVRVQAPGRLAQLVDATAASGAVLERAFVLAPAPKKPLVSVGAEGLELKGKLAFVAGGAVLAKGSAALLDQAADAIARLPVPRRIRIEAHTGTPRPEEAVRALSLARANVVRDQLLARGLPADLLEAAGLGGTRPLAPSISRKGRELNERVELRFAAP